MASAQELSDFLGKHKVPEEVIKWIMEVCGLDSVADFVSYFAPRAGFEKKVESILQLKFPVKAPRDEDPGFPAEKQMLYVARVRTAYKHAIDVEAEQVEDRKVKQEGHEELEVEALLRLAS